MAERLWRYTGNNEGSIYYGWREITLDGYLESTGGIVSGAVQMNSLGLGDGTVSAPAINFTSDTNTGIYRPGDDQLAFTTGGAQSALITSTGLTMSVPLFIDDAANTASAPALSFDGDTNTGIYHPTTDELAIATAGTQRVLVGSTGEVTLSGALTVDSTTSDNLTTKGSGAGFRFYDRVNTTYSMWYRTGSAAYLWDSAAAAAIVSVQDSSPRIRIGTGPGSSDMALKVYASTHVTSEHASIGFGDWTIGQDSSSNGTKNLYISDTTSGIVFTIDTNGDANMPFDASVSGYFEAKYAGTPTASGGGSIRSTCDNSAKTGLTIASSASTGTQYFQAFYLGNGTLVGSISSNSTTTSYNTTSDARLKDRIKPLSGALERLSRLRPISFGWKSDPDGPLADGFLAQEVAEVVPQATTGLSDAVDDNGKIVPMQIDTSHLVPLLTAAMQEQQGYIESIEAQLASVFTRLDIIGA